MILLAGLLMAGGLAVLGAQIENGLLALARALGEFTEAVNRFNYHYERKP